MMPIRAVIFDFGGVLMRLEDTSLHQKWEAQLDLEEGGLIREVLSSEMAVRALRGQIPVDDLWQYVATQFKLNAAQKRELEHDFWQNEQLDRELLAFLRGLRPRYKTAILSNALLSARQQFTQLHHLDQVVDEIIISAEEGMTKPHAEIFQLAVQRLGVQPAEAIFVDDWPPNVEGARAVGLVGILFTSTRQVIAEIQTYLDS